MPKKVFAPGNRWLVAYLAFLSAFAPLSTDMYLPALPHMTQALQTTDALSSLSISCFLLLFGASMLFWGPLSDKYGRKPVLYTGALLYVVSSLFLALAQSIWPLLFWRAVQAIGSGGISAMALAIVKDVLRGRAMEKVITWIQTITILAPCWPRSSAGPCWPSPTGAASSPACCSAACWPVPGHCCCARL